MPFRCSSSARWLAGMAAMMLAAGLVGRNAGAQTRTNAYHYTPEQHRAWYIYLIAQYTEWPKDAFPEESAPFVIGILGTDTFGKGLDIIRDKPLKSRKLSIKYFKRLEEMEPCQVLYVSNSEQEHVERILKVVDATPTLTIGEMDGLIVHLWFEPDRTVPKQAYLRFEIDRPAAERARLRLSSYLLNLAKPKKQE